MFSIVRVSTYEWCSGLDVGDIFDVIFIDFRKAFDVVPHDKLVTKLSATGICESTLCWITAFLTNRTQRVCITNNHSSDVPVTSGVIQGMPVHGGNSALAYIPPS